MTRLIAVLTLALALATSVVPASAALQASGVSHRAMRVAVLPQTGPQWQTRPPHGPDRSGRDERRPLSGPHGADDNHRAVGASRPGRLGGCTMHSQTL